VRYRVNSRSADIRKKIAALHIEMAAAA